MSAIPSTYSEHNEVIMSNFDHYIDEEVAEELRNYPLHSRYVGWNFCGYVWWDNELGKWNCEIMVHHEIMEVVTCNTLGEIMNEVCEKYGYE